MADTPMGTVQSGRTAYMRVMVAGRTVDARVPWLLQAVTIVLAVVLYGGRRPDQLSHPMVWAEEAVILGKWLNGQAGALVDPVAGQSVLISSWLVSLSGSISVRYLPEVELLMMTVVFVVTLLLLVLPGSVWGPRWMRCLMALSLAVVPIDPEPYMVLLFAFWWTSLWPLIILGWHADRYWVRLPVLILAGISSLAAALAAPLFAALWLWRRQRRDLWSAVVLTPCLVLQVVVLETSDRQFPALQPATLGEQVLRTFALYFRDLPFSARIQDARYSETLIAVVLISGLVVAVLRLSTVRKRAAGTMLLCGLLGYALLSAIPAPFLTHPSGDGPRYYFLPFALLGLLLFFLIASTRDVVVRVLCIAIVLAGLLPLLHDYDRQADAVSWRQAITACANSRDQTYALPVQANGRADALWTLTVPTVRCR